MKSENLPLNHLHPSALSAGALHRLAETLVAWHRRARERAELTQLDAWTKRDLGLSDGDVWREAQKSRWQE
jgi:uncharacterized protein YjiS (DUF1127 family)